MCGTNRNSAFPIRSVVPSSPTARKINGLAATARAYDFECRTHCLKVLPNVLRIPFAANIKIVARSGRPKAFRARNLSPGLNTDRSIPCGITLDETIAGASIEAMTFSISHLHAVATWSLLFK